MASPETIRDLYDFLAATYGPSKFPPATEAAMHAWHLVLEEVNDDDLGRAVMAHTREESWPPAPADLIKRCRSGRRVVDRSHRPFELEAGDEPGRSTAVAELVRDVRSGLGNVVHLDERRQA